MSCKTFWPKWEQARRGKAESRKECGFPRTPRTDPGVRHYRIGLLPRVMTSEQTTLPPDVPVRAHLARLPGSVSGACFAPTGSPWPTPFPPPPPLTLSSRCSAISSVLWSCPTSRARSSLAYVLRLPSAASLGRAWVSRFPRKVFPCMHKVFDRAGSSGILRWRCPRYGLPYRPTTSTP
jgi:hypothetical protein